MEAVYTLIGYLSLGVMFGVTFLTTYFLVRRIQEKQERDVALKQRIKNYSLEFEGGGGPNLAMSAIKSFFTPTRAQLSRSIWARNEFLRNFLLTLERCGKSMSFARYIILNLALVPTIAYLLFVTKRADMFWSSIISVPMAIVAAYQVVLSMADRRQRLFLTHFPEALETIIRTIRSGATIGKAIAIVGEKAREPVSTAFTVVDHQVQLGVRVDKALQIAATQSRIDEFKYFAVVIAIQQETGGSLVETLDKLVGLVRGRKDLKEKAKAISSEARATAMILGCLPLLFAVILQFMSPGHFKIFFEPGVGKYLFNTAIALMGMGIFTLWRLIQIKV